MKQLILAAMLLAATFAAQAQPAAPAFKISINGALQENFDGMGLTDGDVLTISTSEMPGNKPLDIDGYSIRFFRTSDNSSKDQRQQVHHVRLVTKTKMQKIKGKTSQVTINANDLISEFDFTKVEVVLGTLSNNGVKVPLHSSQRSFTFVRRR